MEEEKIKSDENGESQKEENDGSENQAEQVVEGGESIEGAKDDDAVEFDHQVKVKSSSSYFEQLLNDARENIDRQQIEKCFDHFKSPAQDQEAIEGLNFEDFSRLLNELFIDQSCGESFYIPKCYYIELFKKFDKNGDNVIDKREFTLMWSKWISIILRPKSAFIIVDVQNDFISGSLAIFRCPAGHKGEEVVPVINKLLAEVPFDLVVYSYDWHPNDHISFHENYRKRKIIGRNGDPVFEEDGPLTDVQVFEEVTFQGPPQTDQKLWPRHCVQGSWGAKFHPDVIQIEDESRFINVYKGINSNIDSYSAFWDNNKLSETGLGKELKDRGITDVYVCGLAYDVCVGASAEHAIEYGFRTILVNDASRGIDTKSIACVKNKLINKSAVVTDSDRILNMVTGRERRPELAYHLATFIE